MYALKPPAKGKPASPADESDRLRALLHAELGADGMARIAGGATLGSGAALLAALPVAVYTTDTHGRISFFNEAAATLWGYRPRLGIDLWDSELKVLGADGAPLAREERPMAVALKNGRLAHGMEALLERPDGVRVPFCSYPTPIFDGEGRMVGAINMLVDLTATKAAEAELRESEEHYRYAVELNPQMPWTADPAGNVLNFSERWCRFTGQTREQAFKTTWLGIAHSRDRRRIRSAIRRSLLTGEPLDVRFRARTASGDFRWVRSRAHPRRAEDGTILRWYGYTENIHDSVRAEMDVRAAEERYRLTLQATDDVVWDHDLVTRTVAWNEALTRRFGMVAPPPAKREWWLEQVHPDDRARARAGFEAALDGPEQRWSSEYRFRRGDGSYAHVLDRGALIRDDNGRPIRAIGAILDLSERRRVEEALRLSEERFRLAAAASGLGVADYDVLSGKEHWSVELRAILGVDESCPTSPETYFSLLHPDDRPSAMEHYRRATRGDFAHGYKGVRRIIRPSDGALRYIATEGHAMRNDEGAIVRVIITARDITEEKTTQDRINWAANHDAVTGLPNRTAFQAGLDGALARARIDSIPIGLMLIDLDNFKHVNDTLGHQAGDAILAAFAARIGEAMPPGAIVARFGGDEFAAILPGANAVLTEAAAGELMRRLQYPFAVAGRSIDLRASIGVGVYPEHCSDTSGLVQNADIALYAAKGVGRSTIRTFEPAMRADMQNQVSMLRQARVVFDNRWIEPRYQPKIALETGRPAGFEALLRWRHPRAGVQLPRTIAVAFEDIELAGLIGGAMADAVLADMRGWLDRGVAFGRVAINASAAEFHEPGYAERLMERLHAHDIPATLLELEITETAFLGESVGNVVAALETLRGAGMTVALDDFGTGYSSLSHLRRFPVDAIKIDRSFVAGVDHAVGDRAIVEAILRLGVALGMKTVAEGVETAAQADYLRAQGCMLAQGFLFAPAIEAAAVPAAVKARFGPGGAA